MKRGTVLLLGAIALTMLVVDADARCRRRCGRGGGGCYGGGCNTGGYAHSGSGCYGGGCETAQYSGGTYAAPQQAYSQPYQQRSYYRGPDGQLYLRQGNDSRIHGNARIQDQRIQGGTRIQNDTRFRGGADIDANRLPDAGVRQDLNNQGVNERRVSPSDSRNVIQNQPRQPNVRRNPGAAPNADRDFVPAPPSAGNNNDLPNRTTDPKFQRNEPATPKDLE
jgi:hypothetical protein